MASQTLTWYDYIIFIFTLAISMLIGIYFGCFGKKQQTVNEYLHGGKKMRIIPIAISMAVSHFSGTTLLGVPADVYRYGASIWFIVLSQVVAAFLAAFIYLPVFFKLQLTSTYEYLEKRFDRKTRRLSFVFYILSELLMYPLYIYTPSLAFATASGINVHLVVFVLSTVCIFYTALGGFKTVVWTDIFQFMTIMISLISVCTIGLNKSGGFLSVWDIAVQGERLQVFNFDLDLTARDSFWGYIFGFSTFITSSAVVHQTGVQKFLSLPKYSDCKWSLMYIVIAHLFVTTFCVLIGLVTFAKYKDCDPLGSRQIRKHDQLVPYYVMDIAGGVPGIRGLLIAAVCSASLSSISSNLNSLSGVVYKDMICLFLKNQPTEKTTNNILKIIILVAGILGTCLVLVVERLGELVTVTIVFSGITLGPLLGVFTLGMIFPKSNSKGAFYGIIGGLIFGLVLTVPAKIYQLKGFIKSPTKPLSINSCEILFNTTIPLESNLKSSTLFEPSLFFKISFYFYNLLPVMVTIILGLVISYMTKRDSLVDKNLLTPIVQSDHTRKMENEGNVVYSSVENALEVLEGNTRE